MTANGQDEALLDTGPSLQDAFKAFRDRKRQQQRQVPTKELRRRAAERRALAGSEDGDDILPMRAHGVAASKTKTIARLLPVARPAHLCKRAFVALPET